jgi:transposase InsO family protein
MTESKTVDQFMTRVMGIVNQIRLIGETITDQRIVEKILRSLPKKFEMVVTTILESKDLSKFSIDELIGSLVTHETRLHLIDESISNAFQSQFSLRRGKGRGRSRGRGNTQGNPHNSGGNRQQYPNHNFQGQRNQQQYQHQNFQPQRGRGRRSNDKSSIQCFYCKKYGHYEYECRKKQADQLSGRAHVSNHTGENSGGMFLSCHKTEQQPKDLWLLDSGCSNHMTGNRELLSSIDSSISSNITLGNDYLVKVQGRGTVPILTKQNVKKDISNVYHVPDLKHNLLSVGQLIEKGYKVLFEGISCKIYDKKPSRKWISEIYMTPNRMFPLTLRTANLSQPYAQNETTMNETMVWHTRFGHIPFQSLSLLQKNSMVKGLPIFKEQIPPCESCILGKHKRTSFPQSSNQAKQHLELVYTDLCGPMKTESIGGSFYFLTFIDDFSKKIWIYFLRHKFETFTKFKEFKAEAEKQSGKFLKVLRSDGGGEYNSKEFSTFCKSQGIIMQATTRYTPQQNGVAKIKNQTIMNMARTLLKEKHLSNTFWAEAVACSVYLLNRSPTTSLQMKVPQEAWSGTKLNVAHLRTFGCIAYAHLPSELRRKLDDRSEKCIFTSYSETSKSYRLYNPITKKLILNRDVQFLENQFWDDSKNQQVDSQNPLLPSSENTENSEQPVRQPIPPRMEVQGQPENS